VPGLAVVHCTGAVLRRPSVWPVMPRKEGCFSPAVATCRTIAAAVWGNPADVIPLPQLCDR
jgi:hypothetical protein